jgi:cation transport ATPase
LIGIPVAIIGSIPWRRRGIIVKDPAALEQIDTCRTAIFDKTGTLTYGQPKLTEVLPAADVRADDVLVAVASLERYSRHPLAAPLIAAATEAQLALQEVGEVSERPGEGLRGVIAGRTIEVTSRRSSPRSSRRPVRRFRQSWH